MFTILLAGITFKLILMMQKIIENDFSRMDLNLLRVFLVLYREVSVTRTAEVLHPGQPAIMSMAAIFTLRSSAACELPHLHAVYSALNQLVEKLKTAMPQF